MSLTVRCAWADCKRSLVRRGNRRYCGPHARQARRVANRRSQRRHRARVREERLGEALRSAPPPIRLAPGLALAAACQQFASPPRFFRLSL